MKSFLIMTCVFLLTLQLTVSRDGYAQEGGQRDMVKEHYAIGDRYYEQGKYKEALAEYQKAEELLAEYDEAAMPIKTPLARTVTPVAKFQVAASSEAVKPAHETFPQESVVHSLEYTVSEEDILFISIWESPDLNQEVTVRPDGKISFSLIGDIQASGLTITQLKETIAGRLKEYIKSPVVSISIVKMGGKKIIVLGEILDPGVYTVTGSKSVLEAIGLAGGFTKDAVASSVVVIRRGPGKPEAKRLSLNKALKGDASQNIMLEMEDVVFVPKKFIADLNYFLSQILEPLSRGAYTYETIKKF